MSLVNAVDAASTSETKSDAPFEPWKSCGKENCARLGKCTSILPCTEEGHRTLPKRDHDTPSASAPPPGAAPLSGEVPGLSGEKEPIFVPGCHRSHPHEDMNAECERLTVIARENNRVANEKSEKRPHSAWYSSVCGGFSCHTCGAHAESVAAILAVEADCTKRCVSSMVKPDVSARAATETRGSR